MVGIKLLLIAAVLSVVAFSAPVSTEFVEDISMVQTRSMKAQMHGLQSQFSALQETLKTHTYATVTPGVKAAIDDMTKLITTDIEPAIRAAHNSDQDSLDTTMASIQTYTSAVKLDQDILHAKDAQIDTWISEHNTLVPQWSQDAIAFDAAADSWGKTHSSKDVTCCAKDNAAVVDVTHLKAYGRCDFKAADADNCIAVVGESVTGYTEEYFKKGLALYLSLVQNCTDLKADTITAQGAFEDADRKCDKTAEDTHGKAGIVKEESATFTKDWSNAHSAYEIAIASKENAYATAAAQVVHDEKDRVNEYTSTQLIKCMLVNYRDGGTFDQASMTACTEKNKEAASTAHLVVAYPKMITRLTWLHDPFAALLTYDHPHTCERLVQLESPTCNVAQQKPIQECIEPAVPVARL